MDYSSTRRRVDWEERRAQVYDTLDEFGAMSSERIVSRTGLPIQAVRWCLRELIRQGRVTRSTQWLDRLSYTRIYYANEDKRGRVCRGRK